MRFFLAALWVACVVAPLFGQALPVARNRPERTDNTGSLQPESWIASGTARTASGHPAAGTPRSSGPLAVKQGHEGPEVFTVDVGMHPLLRRYLAMYSSPPWLGWLAKVMGRARPFLGYIDSRIDHYHLPRELRFLPIAESSYDPFAVSKAGAAGLWQLMPKTGSAYGLDINRWVDQRFDFARATDASLETLKQDHAILGNWPLALAAYDAGLIFMKNLVERTGIHDYWKLAADGYLPHETVDYVPRFYALAAICSYPGRYGLPLTWKKPVRWTEVKLRDPVNLRLLADQAGISARLLKEGNAGLRYGVTPPKRSPYALEVPEKDAPNVDRALANGKDSLMLFYVYPVREGDTLHHLAQRYGVPASMIIRYNPSVRPGHLVSGSWLLIPAVKRPLPSRARVSMAAAARRAHLQLDGTYTVRKGDTLWSIAARFAVTATRLAEANGLTEKGIIYPGQKLSIPHRKGSAMRRVSSGQPLPVLPAGPWL